MPKPFCSVVDEPRPMPNSKRPSDRWSSIATRSATRAGWFTGGVMLKMPEPRWMRRRRGREVAEEHLVGREVRVLGEEVVLGRPRVLEADALGGLHDRDLVHDAPVLVAAELREHARAVEQSEFHRRQYLSYVRLVRCAGRALLALLARDARCSRCVQQQRRRRTRSPHRRPPRPPSTADIGPRTPTTTIVKGNDTRDIYAADRPNQLSPTVANFPSLVYVPNSLSDTVDVIDPDTFTIVDHFATGGLPQHVVPSWDLKTLYVTNDRGNSLTPIDPATGKPGDRFSVDDPYNMYFTPDGKYAIVVAERLARLDFRDAHTFKLVHSLQVPCVGVDHMDFSGDGNYLIASCEFSGQMIKVDVASQSVVGTIALNGGNAKPQDVKVDPTGKTFYVADMIRGGVYVVDGASFAVTGFIPTGAGAHGLYVSRDSKTHVRDEPRRRQRVAARLRDEPRRANVADPAADRPTWAASPPTAATCGSRAATTPRST